MARRRQARRGAPPARSLTTRRRSGWAWCRTCHLRCTGCDRTARAPLALAPALTGRDVSSVCLACGRPADVFAFGVVLQQGLERCVPLPCAAAAAAWLRGAAWALVAPCEPSAALYEQLICPPPSSPQWPPALAALVARCRALAPCARPAAAEVSRVLEAEVADAQVGDLRVRRGRV